jgi:hypothetical protein
VRFCGNVTYGVDLHHRDLGPPGEAVVGHRDEQPDGGREHDEDGRPDADGDEGDAPA